MTASASRIVYFRRIYTCMCDDIMYVCVCMCVIAVPTTNNNFDGEGGGQTRSGEQEGSLLCALLLRTYFSRYLVEQFLHFFSPRISSSEWVGVFVFSKLVDHMISELQQQQQQQQQLVKAIKQHYLVVNQLVIIVSTF